MGTTAEKGQRVLQSIAEVQEGINNIGGSLTDQTPFKNFRAELDNIYNNLPKTDYAEGSNITLSNCLKGKLDFEDDKLGYGNTYQYSTTGINLFNITNYATSDKFSNNNATNIIKTVNSISFYAPAKLNGVYVNRTYIPSVVDNYNSDTYYYISADVEVESASKIYFGSAELSVYDLSVGKQRIVKRTKLTNEGIYFYNFNDGAGSFKISNIMVSTTNSNFEQYTRWNIKSKSFI
ncbi:MAG: hypothetical protein IJH55_07620 [Romboutsia sp.]|nr:hypothetical protein [Romboutsia sp.]